MSGLSASVLDRASSVAADMVAAGEHPYLVVGVSDARRTVGLRAFGTQDGAPVAADSLCPVFSVTKPMVAAAVVQLWERGQIAIHEPVARYLPGFESHGKENVLVRHLLTHTSGVNEDGPHAVMREAGGREALERSVLETPLDEAPGLHQRYSNTSYIALGMLISRVSGMTLADYMRREVFLPLEMTSTGFDPSRLSARTVLRVPNLPELGMGDRIESLVALNLAAAGLFSTAEDLLRFGREFLRGDRAGKILGPAARAAMISPQIPGIPPRTPGEYDGQMMGLGWYIPCAPNNKLMALDGAWHSGAGGCQLFVSPRWGVAVSVIAGRVRWRTERIVNAVLGRLSRP